jgi:hypothetical protein
MPEVIVVEEGDEVRRGCRQAAVARGGRPPAGAGQHADGQGSSAHKRPQGLLYAAPGAVIHDEELVREELLGQDTVHGGNEELGAITRRHYHADRREGHSSRLQPKR